jgi:hypothetical protein
MYLLLTDETNLHSAEKVKFLIYGGLFLPIDKAIQLDQGIEKIRKVAGYQPREILKFDTRERPPTISIESATQAKREVVALCREVGCKFVVYVAHHDIIKDRSREDQILFGANSVIERFNRFLAQHGDYGMVLADTLPLESPNQYFKEKFSVGLTFDKEVRPLPRIRLYGTTCSGGSHLSSAIDIVLGSFRYAVNSPANIKAAGEMVSNVTDLMWGYRKDNDALVLETGLILRPKIENIRKQEYRDEYLALLKRLSDLDDLGMKLRDA